MKLKVVEYLNQLEESLDNDNRFRLMYRGHANENWKLESSAARRIKQNTNEQKLIQADFIKYHNVLIDRAKKNVKKNNLVEDDNKSDLELLSKIQHFGGATCLTDFTSNFLVALWFASSKSLNEQGEETNGKIFIINLLSYQNQKDIKIIKKEDEVKFKISELLTYPTKNKGVEKYFAWQPYRLNKRMYHQDSLFIFGLSQITNKNYKEIIVAKEDKQDIRRELKKYFDIDIENVFPDFQGFSFDANNVDAPFNDLYCRNCLEISLDYLENGLHEEHQRYFEKAIQCKTSKTRICQRNNEPCDIKDLSELYYRRAIFKKDKSRTDDEKIEVIRDFKKVLEFKSSIFKADSHSSIAYLYYDLAVNDKSYYEKAIKEYEEIINHYNDNHEYDFCYLSILELSIMKEDKQTYNWYLRKMDEEIKTNWDNLNFIKILFERISKYVFVNVRPDLEKTLNELKKIKVETFNENFIWIFSDLNKWFKIRFPDIDFDTFFNEMEALQNNWIDKSFKINPA